jgi:hypothetical protein
VQYCGTAPPGTAPPTPQSWGERDGGASGEKRGASEDRGTAPPAPQSWGERDRGDL